MAPQNSAKRRQKRPRNNESSKSETSNVENQASSPKKQRTARRQPLAGIAVAVSTLKPDVPSEQGSTDHGPEVSYNAVCDSCKSLGAVVMAQVCKKVELLVSTVTAVKNSTQRVRKAFKRGKPIVSVEWLEACQLRGERVDIEPYRLDTKAREVTKKRTDKQELLSTRKKHKKSETNGLCETDAEEGFERTIDLGCCCVCHELGTHKDCEWCQDCSVSRQSADS